MSKHTPGPWKADLRGMNAVVVCPDGRKIDCGDRVYHDDNEANAQLVAAAPDLLAASKAALDQFDELNRMYYRDGEWECLRVLRAAIAKAEGN